MKLIEKSLRGALLMTLLDSGSTFLPLSNLINRRAGASPTATTRLQPLQYGRGVATNYTWYEEAFEIELSVKVPPKSKAKDVIFKATSNTIDLRLKQADGTELQLLDPNRRLRGRILTDGTYWEIADPEDKVEGDDDDHRVITVTFEKLIKKAKDDFDVVDYDWNGIYFTEFDDEVSVRKYDEPENLDVREYAASMGVDIDNINMSMVDKSMFTSGLNLTKNSMDALTDAGYLKEVTQQKDGSEWVTDEDGDAVPFSSFGGEPTAPASSKIPFVDTDSPWNKAAPPAEKKEDENVEAAVEDKKNAAVDPIDTLTVAKLKEVLKSKGLKVSGNKRDLQARLRQHVNSMLQDSASATAE